MIAYPSDTCILSSCEIKAWKKSWTELKPMISVIMVCCSTIKTCHISESWEAQNKNSQQDLIIDSLMWSMQELPSEKTSYLYFVFSQGRAHIFKIHARSMSVERDIRYELLARLCPNTTGEWCYCRVCSLPLPPFLLPKFLVMLYFALVCCMTHISVVVFPLSLLLFRCRNSQCLYRGWHVCHSIKKKSMWT